MARTLLAAVLLASTALAGCGNGSAATTAAAASEFDGARAWRDLERIVAIGPRPAGTPALESLRVLIEGELRAAGLEPRREAFEADTPAGRIAFANVYADLPAREPGAETVILATHFDTKETSKRFEKPFLGANDGGSGTAGLLEIARALARGGPRALTYRVLFLDGEEALLWGWTDAQSRGLPKDHTYGSRHHAAELKKSGAAARVRAAIVLDMIGDRDLKLFRDTYSDRRLREIVARAADSLGLAAVVAGRAEEVHDDHLSFLDVGIPSIDLIDLDFGPSNSWWHSPEDTLERCSPDSIAAVGRIVLAALPEIETGFARR